MPSYSSSERVKAHRIQVSMVMRAQYVVFRHIRFDWQSLDQPHTEIRVTVRGRTGVSSGCTGLYMATRGVPFVSAFHHSGSYPVENSTRASAEASPRRPYASARSLVPTPTCPTLVCHADPCVDAPVRAAPLLSPMSTTQATIFGAVPHIQCLVFES